MISANVLIGNPNKVDLEFYECCGCTRSHRINIFFTDHYDHPIYEVAIQGGEPCNMEEGGAIGIGTVVRTSCITYQSR